MPQADMSDWTGGHPDEGLLHEWLDEQLPEHAASQIQAHVAACSTCAARVAEARGLIAASHRILAALDDVPVGVIPAAPVALPRPHARDTRWRRWGQVAAVLAVAVAGGSYWLRGEVVTERSGDISDSMVAVTPEVAAPRAAAAVATAPAAVATTSKRVLQNQAASAPEAERRAAAKAQGAVSFTAPRARASAPVAVADTVAALQRASAPAPAGSQALPTTAPMALALPSAPPPNTPGNAVAGARAAGVGAGVAADQVATSGSAGGGRGGAGNRLAQRADTLRAGNLQAFTATSTAARSSDSSAVLRTPPRRLSELVAPESRALFDSVTFIRRVCATSCETRTLLVTAAGVVRYTVGTSNTQRAVMSQLSTADRAQVDGLLLHTFGNAMLGAGTIACATGDGLRGPTLEVIVARPSGVPASAAASCAATGTQLTEFGGAVDALVGAATLRGRMPPGEG